MAVKENQKGLYEATEELFRRSSTREKNKLPQSEHAEKKENVHGRDESRCCRVLYLEKEVSFFPKEDGRKLMRSSGSALRERFGPLE